MDNSFNFEIFETPELSEAELQQKETQKKLKQARNNKKNLTIKIISTITAVIAALAVIFCCYIFTIPAHNPSRLIKSYVTEINNSEWEKAYSRLCFENSTIITEENFISFCTENPAAIALANGKIVDFEIEKDKISDDKNEIYYSVNYVLEDGNCGTFYLSVIKTSHKIGRLAEYSILPSQSCFSSLTITAPLKTEVSVNGTMLKSPEIKDSSLVYTIKYLFADNTEIASKNEFCNNTNETIKLQTGSNNYNVYTEINEECYNKLCELTKGYITSLYTDVINDKEDFSEYPLNAAYKENGFADDLEQIKADVFSGNYTISNFTVTEAEPKKAFDEISKQLNGSDNKEIEIKYIFKYSYTYTYNDEEGNPVSADKTDSGYFDIKYVLENGWYIKDISSKAWF